jgi:uncharacterized protein YjbI with pentapeptide repeats
MLAADAHVIPSGGTIAAGVAIAALILAFVARYAEGKIYIRSRIPGFRPALLIIAVLGTLGVAWLLDRILSGGEVYGQIFHPSLRPANAGGPEWKDLIQTLLVIVGLPVGLMLWHWRDRNVWSQLENQRKDTNLREFQEVQARAVGTGASDLKAGDRQTLQIAALHQLRGYLRGEYGDSFRRPAFELLAALLGRPRQWRIDDNDRPDVLMDAADGSVPLPGPVYKCVRDVVREEWKSFFLSGFPLNGRNFDDVSLPAGAELGACDFSGASLKRVNFARVILPGSNFVKANLEGAYFFEAVLDRSEFIDAIMTGASFEHASAIRTAFRGARGIGTKFRAAILRFSDFSGCVEESAFDRANLSDATLDRGEFRSCSCFRMVFNLNTKLPRIANSPIRESWWTLPEDEPGWLSCSDQEQWNIRRQWSDLGVQLRIRWGE